MSKLDKKIDEWTAAGLISNDQAIRIQTYERQKPGGNWAIMGFYLLGAVVIGIGIISIIASNWSNIPDAVKLGVDFGLLFGLGYFIHKSESQNKLVSFEVLVAVFSLLVLASIGLISQIYHTGGALYQATLFWSIIVLPLITLSRRNFLPFAWVGTFLISLTLTAAQSSSLAMIGKAEERWLGILFILPFLCGFSTLVLQSMGRSYRFAEILRVFILITGVISITAADMAADSVGRLNPVTVFKLYIPSYALMALLIFGSLRLPTYTKIQQILISAMVLIYAILFHLPLLGGSAMELLAAVMVIFIYFLFALLAASRRQRHLFNISISLAGLRFLGLYFQALGSLAITGFGLILSGLLIIGCVQLWYKNRERLRLWAERISL